jgi:hypothetical protein
MKVIPRSSKMLRPDHGANVGGSQHAEEHSKASAKAASDLFRNFNSLSPW